MNDEQLRQAAETFEKAAKSQADATGQLTKTYKALQKQATDASQGIKDLSDGVKAGTRSARENVGALNELENKLRNSGVTVSKETQARIDSIKTIAKMSAASKAVVDTAQTYAKATADQYIEGFKTLVSELQSGGNMFSTAAKLQTQAIDAQLKVTQAATGGMQELGTVLTATLPGWTKLVGVALAGLGVAVNYAAEKQAEIAKFGIEVLNKEVQKTIKTFGEASNAGMFFSDGMTHLSRVAKDTGVSYTAMIGALKGSSADLAQLGGTAGNGAIQVAKTFKAMEPFRSGLLRLGVSTEDQIAGAAQYMAMLARTGQLRGKKEEELAKGTDNYLTNLKAISSITGEEVKAAEARAKKASEQALVQDMLSNTQGESNEKFKNLIKMFPGFEVGISQFLTTGAIANKEQAVAIYNNAAMMKVLTAASGDFKNSQVSADQALNNTARMLTDNSAQMGKEASAFSKGIGLASLMTGQYNEASSLTAQMQRLSQQAEAGDLKDFLARAKSQKNTTDDLTNSVTNATVEFEKMQGKLEELLYKPMKNFADTAKAIVDQMVATLAKLGVGPQPATPTTETAARNSLAVNDAAVVAGPSLAAQRNAAASKLAARNAEVEALRQHREERLSTPAQPTTPATPVQPAATRPVTPADLGFTGDAVAPNRSPFSTVNQRDSEGIANGPTLTGENGPEAHIKLKGGAIPMNIDWSPLVNELREQKELTRQLIEYVSDSKDVQERILNASY